MCTELDILQLKNKRCQCSLVDSGDNGDTASKLFFFNILDFYTALLFYLAADLLYMRPS